MVSRSLLITLGLAGCGRLGFGDGADGAYATAVLADSPVAYFRFDETGGTVANGTSVSGTYEGSFAFGQPGAVDGNPCVRFDGATTRIPVGDVFRFAGNVQYTIEYWIKIVDPNDTRFIVDRRMAANPNDGYTMYLGADYFLGARIASGSEVGYVNLGAPPLDTWMHAALVYDGMRHYLYIDGIEVESSNASGAFPIGSGAGTFTIGDNEPGQFKKLNGWLDELAIYDTALSATQIAAHYAAR